MTEEEILNKLIELYFKEKLSLIKVKEKIGISQHRLQKILKKNNLPIRNISESLYNNTKDKEIIDFYTKGKSLKFIKDKLDTSVEKIYNTLRRNDITLRGRGKKSIISNEEYQNIKKLYCQDKLSLEEIGKIYNVSFSTINKFMDRNGIEKRTKLSYKANVDELKIIKLYNSGLSMSDIESTIQISKNVIYRVLKNNNIKRRSIKDSANTKKYQEKRRKLFLEKNVLENLYVETKLSTLEIAELYKVKSHNINNLLEYYGISRRDTTEIFNDRSFREKLRNKNIQLYGKPSFMHTEEFHKKKIKTFQEKYNVSNPFEHEVFKNKAILTKVKNGTLKCSCPQIYLNDLYKGQLNHIIGDYYVDILIKPNIICEYDGSGHSLSIKLENIETEEFYKKESKREKYIISNGYRIFRIISKRDFLPSDKILYDMLNFIKETNHDLIKFNIDTGELIFRENTMLYNYGDIRKIIKKT